MDYRKWTIVWSALAVLIVVTIAYLTRAILGPAIFLVVHLSVLGGLLWSTRPSLRSPHISHAAAQAAARDGDVILYWRPGCIFCDLLRAGLGSARPDVSWVNILDDAEAAEFVTTYRNGDETVPTAVTGAGQLIAATPAAIKAQLRAASQKR